MVTLSQLSSRRRNDALIALGAGLAGFAMAFAGRSLFASSGRAMWVLLSIVLIAAVSASVAVALLHLNKLPRESGLHLAGKTGGRAGLMAAYLAAAFLITGLHLGNVPGLLHGWLAAVQSVLPGALAGILAALGTASGSKFSEVETASRAFKAEAGGRGWIAGVVALGLFGFASPLILHAPSISLNVEAASSPRIIASAPPVRSEPERAPSPSIPPAPVIPAFEFKPDPELAKARPESWDLSEIRPLPDVDTGGAVALSPDQSELACLETGSDGNTVMLMNLRTLRRERSWRVGGRVSFIAFSTDGTRLAVLRAGNSPELSLLGMDGSEAPFPVVEPLPEPNLGIEWRKESEISFHSRGKLVKVLNLDTLLLSDDAGKGFSQEVPKTDAWQFTLMPLFQNAALPPPAGGDKNWRLSWAPCVALSHPAEDLIRLFPGLGVSEGERFLFTKDGNILVRLGRKGAFACYFKQQAPLSLDYEVTMPHEPDKFPAGSPFREKEGFTSLRVMAYAPMLHPLSRKCLGPDRSRILGRARIVSWEGSKVKLRMTEFTGRLLADSVFADPHIADGSSLELIALETPHRWWAEANQSASPTPAPPDVAGLPSNRFKVDRGAFAPGDFEWPLKRPSFPPLPSASSRTSSKGYPAAPGAATEPDTESVRSFVLEHHRKASAGDWAAVGRNYDVSVNYFEKGFINPNAVMEDLREYHTKFRVKETVTEPLQIRELRNGTVEVRYELVSEITSQATPYDRKNTKVVLTLRRTSEGFRILAHNPKR